MAKYNDRNVFCVYGFEKNGQEDPAEITRQGIENNSIMKCPVLAQDAAMAVDLFNQKYPDLMIAGIVNLDDMKKEVALMEQFKTDNEV